MEKKNDHPYTEETIYDLRLNINLDKNLIDKTKLLNRQIGVN